MLGPILCSLLVVAGPPKLPDTLPGEVPAAPGQPPPSAVESPSEPPAEASRPADGVHVGDAAPEVAPPQPEPAAPPAEPTDSGAPVPLTDLRTEPGPSEPASADACPCSPGDWSCRQVNIVACSDGVADPPPSPPADDLPDGLLKPEDDFDAPRTQPERTPTMAERHRERKARGEAPARAKELDPSVVKGALFHGGVGVGGCSALWCAYNPVSVMAHGGMGYRLGRVALVAHVWGGGGPRTGEKGSLTMIGTDLGLEVFPVRTTAFEPYLGIGIGYVRVTEKAPTENVGGVQLDDFEVYVERGGVKATVGWPFWIRGRWSIGPRFDYVWTFAGQQCDASDEATGADRSCLSVSDLVDQLADGGGESFRRGFRRAAFPRPWTFSLELRRQF